jgi:branched-chain amino acid transport system ATP-binding protein
MRDALLQLTREGVAMLVAEQNTILAGHAQRVLVLSSGRIDAAA